MATLAHGTRIAQPGTGLRAVLARFAAWRAHRREVGEALSDLRRMDPRELRDLGITPYDFTAIAEGRFRR